MNIVFRAFLLIASLVAVAASHPLHIEKHETEVDLEESTITWLGKKVVGQHSGTIGLKSAHLDFKDHQLSGGEFEIDMTTIVCTDLQGKKAQSLVGHLNSPDFFEVEKYPTAKLEITSATRKDKQNYEVSGNLTIKGASHPIIFEAAVNQSSATATINVDRTLFGIKYGSGTFFDNLGDKAIENEFQLTVNLVFK